MIVLKIDVLKIDKTLLYKGEKGTYLDLLLFDKPNVYGDDGYVRQGMTRQQKEEGREAPIVGNWRNMETKAQAPKPQKPPPKPLEEDEIPW